FSFGAVAHELLAKNRTLRDVTRRFLFLHTLEAHDPYLHPPQRPGPPPPVAEVDLAAIDREAAEDGGRSLARPFLVDFATRSAVFDPAPGRARAAIVTRWFERGYAADPRGVAVVAEAREAYRRGLSRLDGALATWLEETAAAGLMDDTVFVLS